MNTSNESESTLMRTSKSVKDNAAGERSVARVCTPELAVRVYSPEGGLKHPSKLLREMLDDILAGRELAWRLFTRDVKAQYRQTYLGYIWAFLPPLVASATFIFLQSQGITNIEVVGMPYAAFAMIGTFLWQTFVDSMLAPVNSINSARPMLAKINFPREAILMAGMYMVIFNFLIRMILLIGVMVVWQVIPSASIVLFPLIMAGLLLCGFAIGMMLVPVGGLYGDVTRAVPIVAQFWMLLTPVVYPARTEGLAGWLAVWNPISPLIVSARATLTGQTLPQLWIAVIIIAIAAVVSFFGLLAFRLIMPHLIARMGG